MEMAAHSSILAWEIPAIPWQRNLVGYSPKGCKELDMTEQLSTQHIFNVYNTKPSKLKIFLAHVRDEKLSSILLGAVYKPAN